MKRILLLAFLISSLGALSQTKKNKKAIQWHSWEEGIALAEKKNKKVFVDIYTDWCGFCRKMDADTFSDPEVAKYMNKNFIMIKLDGESKEVLSYKGQEYAFKKANRRGHHELAEVLVGRKPPYPTFVVLDQNQDVVDSFIGYKNKEKFMPVISYYGSESYKEQNWDEYYKAYVLAN
ncbi:MAG: thioredoxin domain-containing protein [Saprospiraceae bacterium]|nr:thioredoxin domain-containing protein [Saprospiraceae bacterium]